MLAGRVNPVPPICELDGPRTSEVRKETKGGGNKKDDMKKRMKEKATTRGLGSSRPEGLSGQESRAWEEQCPCPVTISALSFPWG